MTTQHRIGTEAEWRAASDELLAREKEHMRMGDELARGRRELPWVPVEKDYVFQTADGERTLAELFDGRSQLLVYHFMFGPDDTDGCVGCSFLSDHLDGAIPHVHARDITVKVVSRGPLERLQAYRERMGWKFDWVSSEGSDFNFDFGVSSERGESPKLTAFALEDGVVYKTYESIDRGLEVFDGAYHLIDRAPKGRQEDEYEYFPGEWWKRHDEYEGVTV
jgi:predicted dithiol-disulfide oxidoreductase (DUF899 family)